MSKSKEGMDKENNVAASRQTQQPRRSGDLDDRLGAQGQTDYTAGRESWSEYPRRSTSFRRDESDRSSQNRYDLTSRRDYRARNRADWRERNASPYETRHDSSRYYADRPRSRANRYDQIDRVDAYDLQDDEQYGRHSYNDLRYGRADHEDLPRSQDRYRANERAYNDYGAERTPYDDPYNRVPLSSRYDSRSGDDWRGEADDRARRDWQGDWRGREVNYLRCSDIMTKNVNVCSPQMVVRDIADKMQDDNVGSIPVVDGGRLLGIVTDRDIVCRIIAEGRDTRTTPASEAMSEDLVICTPDESVVEAIRKMGEHQIRRIPVCDLNGRLRGIIAMADIALEAERDRYLAAALEQISQPSPKHSRRV